MTCLCATTRRAARNLTRIYSEALKPADLTPAQFELLATISGFPAPTQSLLADALDLDQTTLSRNVKAVERSGWVATKPDHSDHRQVTYRLTADGRKVLAKAMPLWNGMQGVLEAKLGPQWEPTLAVLSRLAKLPGDRPSPDDL